MILSNFEAYHLAISQEDQVTITHRKWRFPTIYRYSYEKFSRGQAHGRPIFLPPLLPRFSLTPKTNLVKEGLIYFDRFFILRHFEMTTVQRYLAMAILYIFPINICRQKCLMSENSDLWPPPPKKKLRSNDATEPR